MSSDSKYNYFKQQNVNVRKTTIWTFVFVLLCFFMFYLRYNMHPAVVLGVGFLTGVFFGIIYLLTIDLWYQHDSTIADLKCTDNIKAALKQEIERRGEEINSLTEKTNTFRKLVEQTNGARAELETRIENMTNACNLAATVITDQNKEIEALAKHIKELYGVLARIKLGDKKGSKK